MPQISISENRIDGTLSKKLALGVDYTIGYTNNINAGTATVKYKDDYTHLGIKILTFEIIPKSCTDLMIASIPRQEYTGQPITPALIITNIK